MNCKIIKRTNPLGGVVFIAKVKRKFLFIFSWWESISYNKYRNAVETDWIYEHKFDNIVDAREAVQKYYQWKKGRVKIETLGCPAPGEQQTPPS